MRLINIFALNNTMRYLITLLLLPSFLQAQINGSFSFGGQTRNYIVHLPAGYVPGQSLPLVFVLHGFTQNGAAIQTTSGFDLLADAENFIAVYPTGVNNAWNTNSGFPGGSTADDVGFISALIDTMQANYNIDLNRVYSCGFSAGGFMSHRLACESSAKFAAIASVSGTMSDAAFSTCIPSNAIPVMQIHGTADGVVSYTGGIGGKGADDIINFWKGFNNCSTIAEYTALPDTANDGSNVEQYEYSGCNNCSKVVLLKVINGGHQWPGTSSALGGLGSINRDINASSEIWNFFKNFTASGCSPNNLNEFLTNENVKVFPNPASNIIFIETSISGNGVISIVDLSGRVIETRELNTGLNSINIELLNSGLYMLKIQGKNFNTSRLLSIVK